VAGAAFATVLSQAGAALLVVWALARGRTLVRVRKEQFRPDLRLAWRLLRIGMPSSAQMLARSLMGLVLMKIVAACGNVAVAGYGIGLRIHMIILMPAFTLGNAAAAMVGQNLGAGRPDRATRAAWLAVWMDVAIMVVCAVAMLLFAPQVVRAFSSVPAVIATGSDYLRTVSPFYVFTALAIVLGRALQGAGDAVSPMVLTILCLWGLQVPLAVHFAKVIAPPTQGIWWSIAAAVTVHGLLTAAWFQTGRWKTKRV
jgi:putative MATE family efflux protein